MTQYSSGKYGDTITADPMPWRSQCCGLRWPTIADDPENNTFDPRPEFDRPLTNPANPVLEYVREVSDKEHAVNWLLHEFNWDTDRWVWDGWQVNPEHIEHARKVLSRLEAFA